MTSNDLVIPAGIRLRIPSLLVFPGQVSCGEKPKATVFPFCWRGALLRLMSTSEVKKKQQDPIDGRQAKTERNKTINFKVESGTDSYWNWCLVARQKTSSPEHRLLFITTLTCQTTSWQTPVATVTCVPGVHNNFITLLHFCIINGSL